jgi:hypothetical protein
MVGAVTGRPTPELSAWLNPVKQSDALVERQVHWGSTVEQLLENAAPNPEGYPLQVLRPLRVFEALLEGCALWQEAAFNEALEEEGGLQAWVYEGVSRLNVEINAVQSLLKTSVETLFTGDLPDGSKRELKIEHRLCPYQSFEELVDEARDFAEGVVSEMVGAEVPAIGGPSSEGSGYLH